MKLKLPKAIQNSKGHFVIPISQKHVIDIFEGYGICDSCSTVEDKEGFLIPVLGSRWYCTKCYEDFERTAINYPEDREYEQRVLKSMEHRIAMFESDLLEEFNLLNL